MEQSYAILPLMAGDLNSETLINIRGIMNIRELKVVVAKSNLVFERIKEKYSELSSYLVFASPDGYCCLTCDLSEILKTFPAMIADSQHKEKAMKLLDKIPPGKPRNGLSKITEQLEVKENTFIELRYYRAHVSMIYKLQKDRLVSRKHTPQSETSVRTVLGTIGEIYRNELN